MNDPPPHLVELPIEGGHVAADSGTGVPAQVDLQMTYKHDMT